jgi:hypothetical protein
VSDLLGQMERLVDGATLRGDCSDHGAFDLLACIWTLEGSAALSFSDHGTLFFMSGAPVGLSTPSTDRSKKPPDAQTLADARQLLVSASGAWSLRWGISALTGFSRCSMPLTELLLALVTDHPMGATLSAHAVSEWSGCQVRFDSFRPLAWRADLKPAIAALQRGVRADRSWLPDDALRGAILTLCDHLGGLEEVSFIGTLSFGDGLSGD